MPTPKSDSLMIDALHRASFAARPRTLALESAVVLATNVHRNCRAISERCGTHWTYARKRKHALAVIAALAENEGVHA
jgi:hypothetical protein